MGVGAPAGGTGIGGSPVRSSTDIRPYHAAVPRDLTGVRAELPSLAAEVYLNAGGSGPLPRRAAVAIGGAVDLGLGRGRLGPVASAENEEGAQRLRAAVGRLLGAPSREVALTGNSTSGLNAAIWGIDWRPGDEAITTPLEHPGLSVPLRVMAERTGATLRILDLADGSEDLEAAVAAAAGPRTRLVALSHVAYGTGAVLDVAGAARAARAVGALTVVDGAQGVGAIPTDPRALGADAYALPAQKWLLGPEGLGALWVRSESLDRIACTFSGYDTGTEHQPDGRVAIHPGARRFETSTPPEPLLPGWEASLAWLEELGWDWVHARVREAAAAARGRLEQIAGVRILTPAGDQAGLVTFVIRGVEPAAAYEALAAGGVVIRPVPHPAALRLSAGFYTDEADLERLEAGVRVLVG